MPIDGSGEIQLSDIYNEFTGTHDDEEIQLSDYHGTGNAPASGEIQLAADFYGTAGATWYGSREIFAGGDTAPTSNGGAIGQQNTKTVTSTSSASSYGYLTASRHAFSAISDGSYIWYFGGRTSLNVSLNVIEKKVFASSGNSSDVGDMSRRLYATSAVSDGTRGVIGYGIADQFWDTHQITTNYLTFASDTSMTSFGNLREKRFKAYAEGSATKGIFAGGENNNGAAGYHVDYITISSAGNYTNFGIFTGYNGGDWGAAVGSDTRMWLVGGFGGSLGANMNQMVYITIASTGNTTDAGDLDYYKYRTNGCSDGTKAEIAHGIKQLTLGHSTSLESQTTHWTISSTSNASAGVSMGGWGVVDSEGAAGT